MVCGKCGGQLLRLNGEKVFNCLQCSREHYPDGRLVPKYRYTGRLLPDSGPRLPTKGHDNYDNYRSRNL